VVPPHRRSAPIRYRYLRKAYPGRTLLASRRLRWGALSALVFLYTINFVSGDHGFLRREHLQKERNELHAENARLLSQKDRLLQEVKAQQNDPLSLERLAREKYWLVGPGERIYRFEDDEVVPEVELPEPSSSEEP